MDGGSLQLCLKKDPAQTGGEIPRLKSYQDLNTDKTFPLQSFCTIVVINKNLFDLLDYCKGKAQIDFKIERYANSIL